MPSFFKNQKSKNNLRSQANQTSSEQTESSLKSLLLRICCLRTLPLLIGTATLFKIKSPSRLVYPLGIIVLFLSITIASNFQEHLYEGLHVARFLLHMPLFSIIPILLLIIAFLKNRKKQHR